MTLDRGLAKQHYAEHEGKPFFGELVEFITSGPLVAMVLEGHEAVKAARQVIGATNPLEATTGSIRGDFAIEVGQNMVHGSDSPESAEREARALLPEPELTASSRVALDPRAGSPQRRAILEQRRASPFEVAARPDVEERRPRATAREVARPRTRAARPLAVARRARARRRHASSRSTATILGKPRDAAQARGVRRAPRRAARTRSSAAIALARDGAVARRRVAVTARARSARSTPRWSTGTSATGRVAGPRRRLRDPGRAAPRSCAAIEGDYLNVVGLPLRALLDLLRSCLQRVCGFA